MFKIAALSLALVAGCSTTAGAQSSQDVGRAYTVSFKPKRGVYCIRFFSDALYDPWPHTQAPTCLTKARWAQLRIFIEHRRSTGEIPAR